MSGPGRPPSHPDADASAPVPAQPSAKPETNPANIPLVPDYELLRRVGHGAYGDVWLARIHATGALRAANIVWRHTFENDRPYKREFEGIQRFERVSREHPSQLALFHISRNEAQGYFYYVMELADDVSAERGVPSAESSADAAVSTPHSALPRKRRCARRVVRGAIEARHLCPSFQFIRLIYAVKGLTLQ